FGWTHASRGVTATANGHSVRVIDVPAPQRVDHTDDRFPLFAFDPVSVIDGASCSSGATDPTAPASDGVRRARAAAETGAAAMLTGLAAGALEDAVDYAKKRHQY